MISSESPVAVRRPDVEAGPAASELPNARSWLTLAVATLGFGVNFWAWALISPLGPYFHDTLHLTSFQQALLVAVPVVVGSLGRVPVGALTDRFGARVMFPVISFLAMIPVLFVGKFGDDYARLLVGGLFLGIAGTAFAVGVPLVNSWFPPARRGLALGIFGIGMGGTAISAFTTVKLKNAHGQAFPFVLVATVLLVYGLLAMVLVRDRPGRQVPSGSWLVRAWTTFKMKPTLQLSFLYAVGFGGFVAFSVYLPTYLKNVYGLTQSDAASRTAGFVIIAVLARPVGGWLSDRLNPVPVLVGCLSLVTAFAFVAALGLNDLVPIPTIAFLAMAAGLGAAAGAVFALVAMLAPPEKVGAVTGVVGAAGGLGGFIPPLVMGALYGATGEYTIGFALLALVALSGALYTARALGATSGARVTGRAQGGVAQ